MPSLPIVRPGPGDLPTVHLQTQGGGTARITLHGGHVIGWQPAGRDEQLFTSRTAIFQTDSAIRGGVPVIFPQFAGRGPLPKHGFARTALWTLVTATADTVRLSLTETPASLAVWPHPFQAELTVALGETSLSLTLTITNSGPTPFTFTGALHTYVRVAEVEAVRLHGLAGLGYEDSAQGGQPGVQGPASPTFGQEVDRIYFDAGPVTVEEPGRAVRVTADGFRDVVVWNPGPILGAKLADLEPGGFRHMLCVEAAAIGRPITLAPGVSWQGTQTLSV